MATAVTMPALGESVTEGTVTTWLKKVGDPVAVDEPIVEISTDKVDSEVPSPVAGVLLEISVPEDETVEVGTQIALIGEPSEAGGSPAPETPAPASEPAPEPAPAPAPAGPASGTEVTMPALGESVTEGTVTTWLKKVGDAVAIDEPLLEVSTDKVDSEVPAPASGYLAEIRVPEDETVEVGTVVAVITESAPTGASSPAPAAPAAPAPEPAVHAPAHAAPPAPVHAAPAPPAPVHAAPAPPAPAAPAQPPAAPRPAHPALTGVAAGGAPVAGPTQVFGTGTGYVTPIVRKLARELGVDLAGVTGTGIGGRIRREDVEAAAAAAKAAREAGSAGAAPSAPALEPSPLRGTTEKMTRLRQTIATRMVESLQTAAQLTTVVEVDVTRIAALRARAKTSFQEREGTKLTFLPFFVRAATEALLYHPKINATISGKEVTYFDHENVGIAVDTPRGLLVPVIRNAGGLSIADIARSINDLAARTRDSKVSPDELSGSTFTITNTGSGGALFDTPVLNMPETAILGIGTIVKRPVVVKDADGADAVAIRSMVYLALSYDHRLVDGGDAARYLMTVKKRLEEGDFAGELGL
ncbi:2-oxoglutarate dehydrogenase, E2 component, dihydrolipoamide succinyltransferase [Schaalia naturae]|uniref:Dihydrolipoamide acetyltransferase component of pyruvate dehydrogenase complex n=3 Tax=Schaalia naturae TaxID=635203 RepID=A0ABW2SKZ9_9ACTO